MFTRIPSAALFGLHCTPIMVEVDIAGSWPGYHIVGLPNPSIQEAKERIRSAWRNTGLHFPNNGRIVINLAPADVRKEGSHFDLPMGLGMYLALQGSRALDLSDALFVGELALDGTLREINGVLPFTLFAAQNGYRRIFVPAPNAREAQLCDGVTIYPVTSFGQLIRHLTNEENIEPATKKEWTVPDTQPTTELDMAHIIGQTFAKRALEIAASGGHNLLFNGPPGSGKTLLARTIPSLLPPLTKEEAVEVTTIYSVAGLLPSHTPLLTTRPFRSPHHSTSGVALVGGGTVPKPGEISLAHRGVLFLDEFPEFPRHVLETLRQPLEDGVVTISRAQGSCTFPARLMLVASQNPCPCGSASDPDRPCVCSPGEVVRYQKKMSGPLLDRIDMHVEVPRVPFSDLAKPQEGESSETIRQRVEEARARQYHRFQGTTRCTNSEMAVKEISHHCRLDERSSTLLKEAGERLHLSARSYHRVLKLARTIADLELSHDILESHLAEALQYRPKNEWPPR